ncbi:MAG TPA: alpha/beta hydrolase [Vicinamibacterales bacterium]|nr:alpha/beta hydrolase [Vicinamibacterales bacterium]
MSTSDLPPIRKWEKVRAPVGAVHIIHGLAEHAERYDELAGAMNQAHLIVWAHHQRGHGRNPIPGIKGHFADKHGWRALIDDAWAVSKNLLDTWRLPVVMFAHSMGSFVGQGVLAEHGAAFRAAAFSGTNGPPPISEHLIRNLAKLQVAVLKPRNPGLWLQKIVIEDTYNAAFGKNAPPNTWLSRDPDEVEKYTHDKECGFPLTSQAWLDMLNGRADQSSVDFFRKIPPALPIHIIAGTADAVGEHAKGVRRLLKVLEQAQLSNVTSKFYDDARHELVHETNRKKVIEELVDWIVAAVRR